MRARCNRWDCLYCGLRKVDQWRQLVKATEQTLFITLTKAGKSLDEEEIIKRSSWSLVKYEEFTDDIQEYRRRRRKALLEALIDLREGRNLSRSDSHVGVPAQ